MRRFRLLENNAEHLHLAVLALVLASICVLELVLWSARADLAALASSGPNATGITSEIRIPPLPDSHEFTARPLFHQTRRAPLIAPEPEPAHEEYVEEELPETAPTPDYALSAVIIAEGQRIAYLSEAEGMALIPVRQGESIGEWQLAEVGQDYAVLESGQNRIRLDLHPADARLYEEADGASPSLPIQERR